jgi:CheY-like chemotaxis protein
VRKAAPKRKVSTASSGENAIAALAHDIRTPLTGILALAELLAASDLPARERGWAEAIKGAAEHLAQSTTLVLDAAKARRGGLVLRRETFSPRRLAEQVAALLAARAGTSGLTAKTAIAGDLPAQVIGDRVRLRAALENLVDNAVKFTPRGRVTFAVTATQAGTGRRRGVELVFVLADSGIGLTPAELRKLFKPFAQASGDVARRFGGTGLGLVLVKRLAQAMHGDLTVASEPGKGSTFTLRVRLECVPERAPAGAGSAEEAAGEAPALRILCAEDNPFGRVVLGAMLAELGHRVDFASTGEAALAGVQRGDYDVVLMDVTLPGMDGLTATRRIRALPGEAARIPVIGISALSSDDDIARAREAGMSDYLVKPVSPAALVAALGKPR